MGWSGSGALTIGAGGLVESQKGIISRLTGSTGIVSISGANARWVIAEELHVGGKPFNSNNSNALMTIQNGGAVQVGTNINIWAGGKLSIADDANLGTAPAIGNPDYLHIDGGTFSATGNINLNPNRGPMIAAGGATIEVAENMTLRILGQTNGIGGLAKTGAGTLIIAGTPLYSGQTQANEGWLRIETSANLHSISGPGKLGIGNDLVHALVTADGVFVDTISVAPGSTLSINPIAGGPLSAGNGLTAVPEPSAIILLLLGAIAALSCRQLKKL